MSIHPNTSKLIALPLSKAIIASSHARTTEHILLGLHLDMISDHLEMPSQPASATKSVRQWEETAPPHIGGLFDWFNDVHD